MLLPVQATDIYQCWKQMLLIAVHETFMMPGAGIVRRFTPNFSTNLKLCSWLFNRSETVHLNFQPIGSSAPDFSINQRLCFWLCGDCALERTVQWNNERLLFWLKMFFQRLKTSWLNRKWNENECDETHCFLGVSSDLLCPGEAHNVLVYQQEAPQKSRQASWNNVQTPWNNLCNKLFDWVLLTWHSVTAFFIFFCWLIT